MGNLSRIALSYSTLVATVPIALRPREWCQMRAKQTSGDARSSLIFDPACKLHLG